MSTKRVPEQNLVQTKPWIIDENDPILQFVDRSKVVIRKSDGTTFDKYLGTSPISGDASGLSAAAKALANTGFLNDSAPEKPDTIDLTDIEGDPIYEQYYDPVSKLVKIKVTLKIRNSSLRKANVKGVDARIYNPGA